jgi:hypothetical protein
MKKCKIEVTGTDSKQGFVITLNNTGWVDFEGSWSCLPGYLAISQGYFWYNSAGNHLTFANREMSTIEAISYAFGSDNPVKNYMWLNGITEKVSVGSSGKGFVYLMGQKGNGVLKDKFGYVSSDVKWKVTEVI